jgi:transglutaminase-like putative cysteine protease
MPLAILAFLAMLVAWTINDSRWILGREALTSFLPWAALGGVIAGFVGARLGWGRVKAAFGGAVAAAIVVPILVGSAGRIEGGDFLVLYRVAAESAWRAFGDLVVHGHGSTHEYIDFQLVLAFLMWGTAEFAASAVYRHRRAVPAIVALGTMLLVNMILYPNDQLMSLIFFSLGALLLLVRMHALEEESDWLRRRIGDPAPLTALTLRGGTVFVVLAVVGSMTLTVVAASAPLKDAWTGATPWFVDIGRRLEPYFSFLSNVRGPTVVDFGHQASIGYKWTTDGSVAVTIQVPATETEKFYWRAAIYDQFQGFSWTQSDAVTVHQDAGTRVLDGTAETVPAAGRRSVTITVDPVGYKGTQVLSPDSPISLDVPTSVTLTDQHGYLDDLETTGGIAYRLVAGVPVTGDADPAGRTENRLRVAGTDYPPAIAATYLGVPDGSIGPWAEKLLAEVESASPGKDPYDLAKTMKTVLQSSEFAYETDVSGLDCGSLSVVECFAKYKRGFCQYYASTMAILLRAEGIPTRLVQGFLPGDRSPSGLETIRNSGSHAWVEVYFPGYGWQMFDPTGVGGQAGSLPPGEPVATPSLTPRPSGSQDTAVGPDIRRSTRPGGGAGTTTGSSGPGTAPFVAIAIILGLAMASLAYAAYRRGPREVTPDGAWRSVTGLARRLGFGPGPTQTVYEYAASLGEVIPSARPELQTVARAKVEVAYGHRVLNADRLHALRAATGRLRVSLLRLALRGPRRR